MADSYDEAAKLYKVQEPLLEMKLAEQGMLLLYVVAWPPQGLYAKKPINSAAGLKGVKWHAYSPTTSRIAELVGAQPVTVQAAELSQAMATGVVKRYNNLFVLQGMTQREIGQIARVTLPLFFLMIAAVGQIWLFPGIVTLLPAKMG